MPQVGAHEGAQDTSVAAAPAIVGWSSRRSDSLRRVSLGSLFFFMAGLRISRNGWGTSSRPPWNSLPSPQTQQARPVGPAAAWAGVPGTPQVGAQESGQVWASVTAAPAIVGWSSRRSDSLRKVSLGSFFFMAGLRISLD